MEDIQIGLLFRLVQKVVMEVLQFGRGLALTPPQLERVMIAQPWAQKKKKKNAMKCLALVVLSL